MAMNKAEKAKLQELETALKFCYTLYPQLQPVYPDVLPPIAGSTILSRGWTIKGYPARIGKAFSSHKLHGFGDGDSPTYHGSLELYSTKELAITAYKHKLFMELAQNLLKFSKEQLI